MLAANRKNAHPTCSTNTEPGELSAPPAKKKKSFMDLLREEVEEHEKTSPQTLTGPTEELNRYMRMSYLPDQEVPTVWWKEHSAMFPHLAKLARRYLFIPATSVPSERLFSKSGELVSAKRSSLSPSTIDQILFLNKST